MTRREILMEAWCRGFGPTDTNLLMEQYGEPPSTHEERVEVWGEEHERMMSFFEQEDIEGEEE